MENPRTIILAVVSAKNDAANQIIVNLFKKIDKKGSRTLGIITKPDCMSTDDERFWFDLALNKEVFLEREWHMVKNRSEVETQATFRDRNEAEDAFFNEGRFKDLPRQSVGVEALRVRLSKVLLRHLIQELPLLKKETKEKLRVTKKDLYDLGDKRDTPEEQRMAPMKMSMQINQMMTAAVNGHYLNSFFESVDKNMPITSGTNIRRFRAVVQHLNEEFAKNMRLRGHAYKIEEQEQERFEEDEEDEQEEDEQEEEEEEYDYEEGEEENQEEHVNLDRDVDDNLPKPEILSHAEAMRWVKDIILRCRGHELPGSVNPEGTSHLFWEQSQPWEQIAEAHIEQVRITCRCFVYQVLEHAAPAEFRQPLGDTVVNFVLDEALRDGHKELKKLLEDKACHLR